MGFFSISDAIANILTGQTDADSPVNELLMSVLRKNFEQMLIKTYYTGVSGTLTSAPSGAVCTDTGASMTIDDHIGRTVLFTTGSAAGNMYTIDDNDATTFTLTGDDPGGDGVASGDSYMIFYDLLNYTSGHLHDGVDSARVILGDGQVSKEKLKTSTGIVSGSIIPSGGINIVMQDYCFFPSPWIDNGSFIRIHGFSDASDPGDTTGRMRISNIEGVTRTYGIRYRYVTATDKPFIYAIYDDEDRVVGVWACDDPPSEYWGMDEIPDNFEPPLIISNARGEKIRPKKEVTIFNYEKNRYRELIERADKDKKLLHEMINDEFEMKGEIYQRKNITI